MKCFKCGAELTDDTKFCSYCGAKIEPQVEPKPIADDIAETEPVIESTSASVSSPVNREKKSMGDQSKEKVAELWSKLTLYGKITTIAIAIFSVMCLVAFMAGKTFAGIIAIIAIVLVIVALLMKKQVIKTPKSWLYIVAFVLAAVLVVPYVSVFRVDNGNAETFKWSDIVLGDVVPEPTSLFGEIISNTDTYLSVYIYKASKVDHASYIEACKSNGFTVDANELGNSFGAYNVSGYTVSLYYNESDSKMHIAVNATREYGALVWPESEIVSMIPTPVSTTGEISKNDETGFNAYVSNTSIDEFKAYIASCGDMGFTIDAKDTEKTYSAKNSEGYTLSVEYQGSNVISISVDVPEYEVIIKVECVENWIFSKYDVDILIDNIKKDTHKHGTDADYILRLKAGRYTITFAEVGSSSVNGSATFDVSGDMEASYKIACYNDKVTVEDLIAQRLEQQQAQAAEDERKAAEAEAAEKAAATMRALEERLPQEMAKRAAVVAITNYCVAIDVFMPDGNTLDASKFHSYADTSGNFFEYYIGVKDWGEWIAKDQDTWQARQLRYVNCYGNEQRADFDVRYDGENYLVSNVVTAFGDLSDPSKSGTSEYSEEFVVVPKLIQDDREQTRLDSYNSWVSNQFSGWDGSHKELAALIKKNLNDEKSFEHIETTYQIIYSEDKKTEVNKVLKSANKSERVEIGDLFVSIQFSAKNAFNATIKNTAFGIVSFANNSITLVAIE